jgi:hypothetical protein
VIRISRPQAGHWHRVGASSSPLNHSATSRKSACAASRSPRFVRGGGGACSTIHTATSRKSSRRCARRRGSKVSISKRRSRLAMARIAASSVGVGVGGHLGEAPFWWWGHSASARKPSTASRSIPLMNRGGVDQVAADLLEVAREAPVPRVGRGPLRVLRELHVEDVEKACDVVAGGGVRVGRGLSGLVGLLRHGVLLWSFACVWRRRGIPSALHTQGHDRAKTSRRIAAIPREWATSGQLSAHIADLAGMCVRKVPALAGDPHG